MPVRMSMRTPRAGIRPAFGFERRVCCDHHQVLAGTAPAGPVRVVDRLATAADIEGWERQKQRAKEDLGRAQALATRSDSSMSLAWIWNRRQVDPPFLHSFAS